MCKVSGKTLQENKTSRCSWPGSASDRRWAQATQPRSSARPAQKKPRRPKDLRRFRRDTESWWFLESFSKPISSNNKPYSSQSDRDGMVAMELRNGKHCTTLPIVGLVHSKGIVVAQKASRAKQTLKHPVDWTLIICLHARTSKAPAMVSPCRNQHTAHIVLPEDAVLQQRMFYGLTQGLKKRL